MVLDRVLPDLDCMIKNFVVSAIVMVCENSIKYDKQVKIEGTLGVTIDDGQIVFIHLSELLSPPSKVDKQNTPANQNNCKQTQESIPTKVSNSQIVYEDDPVKTEDDERPQALPTPSDSCNENEQQEHLAQVLGKIKQEGDNNVLGLFLVDPTLTNDQTWDDNSEAECDYNDIANSAIDHNAYRLVSETAVKNSLAQDARHHFLSKDTGDPQTYVDVADEEMEYENEEEEESSCPPSGPGLSDEYDLIQVLTEHPMGKEVLREYKQTGLIRKTKNNLVQILIGTITKTSLYPNAVEKSKLAQRIIETFPCLKGPGKTGYEYFYTPYSSKLTESGRRKSVPAHGCIEEKLRTMRKMKKKIQQILENVD